VRRRLKEELVISLTTVDRDGMPQPEPVWFLWEGESVLVCNFASARRLDHLRVPPRLSLNFGHDGQAGGAMVIWGWRRLWRGQPPADRVPAFVAKYRELIVELDPEAWAQRFPVPLRIEPLVGRTWALTSRTARFRSCPALLCTHRP
jgi:PPOX class probable F420-dependent enzyme